MKKFEIREGNGNDGCYKRGIVEAESASKALIKAHRQGMICSPRDVRITKDIEGDDFQATVSSYAGGFDYARWTAEANDIEYMDRIHHEALVKMTGMNTPYLTDIELAS